MLGPTKGGAVHLSAGSGALVVAEGIETTLSLMSGLYPGDHRFWAALSATGMAALDLPERPGRLVIAPDGDQTGREAAIKLAERACALGWRVFLLPAPEGQDWNDVLQARGAVA
ncbi:toprim domain-containing protein [Phycobacter sp. 'Weihai']